MSAKSRHGRGKHHHGKKKGKFRHAHAAASVPQPQVAASDTPRVEAPPSTPQVVKTPVQKRASTSAALPLHYEFIAGDLKRIGILTGIIVILLIVAYYIFS